MKGFTLLELLLSVALLSIIFGMSYAFYTNIIYQGDLDITARSAQSLLRKATLLSSATKGDSTWGVAFGDTQIVMFKGTSYASRDQSYDEVVDLLGNEVSGEDEYVFEKVSGELEAAGNTTLTNTTTGGTKVITVNEKGRVTIE